MSNPIERNGIQPRQPVDLAANKNQFIAIELRGAGSRLRSVYNSFTRRRRGSTLQDYMDAEAPYKQLADHQLIASAAATVYLRTSGKLKSAIATNITLMFERRKFRRFLLLLARPSPEKDCHNCQEETRTALEKKNGSQR